MDGFKLGLGVVVVLACVLCLITGVLTHQASLRTRVKWLPLKDKIGFYLYFLLATAWPTVVIVAFLRLLKVPMIEDPVMLLYVYGHMLVLATVVYNYFYRAPWAVSVGCAITVSTYLFIL